jgi:hypothetical protein
MRAVAARLIRTLPFASLQIGAQVASLRCPILRWSTSRLPALPPQTRGSDKSPLLIAPLLLLTTHCLLLLSRLSPFARTATALIQELSRSLKETPRMLRKVTEAALPHPVGRRSMTWLSPVDRAVTLLIQQPSNFRQATGCLIRATDACIRLAVRAARALSRPAQNLAQPAFAPECSEAPRRLMRPVDPQNMSYCLHREPITVLPGLQGPSRSGFEVVRGSPPTIGRQPARAVSPTSRADGRFRWV